MSNEIAPQQVAMPFDFTTVSTAEATALKVASAKGSAACQQVNNGLIGMGEALIEAKTALKDEPKLFTAWIESDQWPTDRSFAYKTIKAYEQHLAMVRKSGPGATIPVLNSGILVQLARVKNEDDREAMENVAIKMADEGNPISKREAEDYRKALDAARKKAEEEKAGKYEARQKLAVVMAERDKALDNQAQLRKEGIAGDRQRKALVMEKEAMKKAFDERILEEMRRNTANSERLKAQFAEELKNATKSEEDTKAHETMLAGLEDKSAERIKEIDREYRAKNKELKDKHCELVGDVMKINQEIRDLEGTRDNISEKLTSKAKVYDDLDRSLGEITRYCREIYGQLPSIQRTQLTENMAEQLDFSMVTMQRLLDAFSEWNGGQRIVGIRPELKSYLEGEAVEHVN